MGHDLDDRPGRTQAERQIGYRVLFRDARDAGFIEELRAATNGGWALGARGSIVIQRAMLAPVERPSPRQIPTPTLSPLPITKATSVIKPIATELCVAAEFCDAIGIGDHVSAASEERKTVR